MSTEIIDCYKIHRMEGGLNGAKESQLLISKNVKVTKKKLLTELHDCYSTLIVLVSNISDNNL